MRMDNSYHKLMNGKRSLNNSTIDLEKEDPVPRNSMGDYDTGLTAGAVSPEVKRVRLRAVESEKEFFFKLLNVSSIRRLVYLQAVFSVTILISQVILYALASGGHNMIYVSEMGMGIWTPILFSIASGLSVLAIKSPTGCMLGTAMAFQIISALFGSILVIVSTISLTHTGRYSWQQEYDPQILTKILCSLIVLSGIGILVSSIFVSIQFCRATCCGRYKATEFVLFDVETVKI